MPLISTSNRNYLVLITTVIFSFFLASANAQTWSAQVIGGSATAEKCAATCMDASGNVYVAGTINSGTSTFGSSTFTSAGLFDGIVLKYNSAGVLQWGYRFGSTLNDNALAIATDGSNVYVAGTFTGSMTIGASALTSAGGADGVVMSLNASTGAANWGTSFGGTSTENVFGLTLDPSSNVYITGNFFSSPATFGSFSLTPSSGTSDMFVAKLNSSGTFQWANNGGGTGNDNPVGAGISYIPSLSEIVVVGGVNGGGTCTYGAVTFAASTGAGNDIILLEVNAGSGAFISGTAAGAAGSFNEDALASCYDAFTGNVMLSGYFNSPSFTLGSATLTNSTAAGSVDDMFYASYNPTTNVFAWAKSAGGSGTGSDRARAICSNGTGGIILGGLISGNSTCTFPSASTVQITNVRTNGGDPFLAQIDASTGNAVWAKVGAADASTSTDNAINAVTCSSSGIIWGAGLATTNLTFSPLTALTSTGGVDIFAVKLIAPPPLSATQSQVNLTCNGVCTGSATVVASGGTSPYTYSWSPSGGSGATASSLCATNYTVTITDAASASITKTYNITQPPAIIVTPVSQTNVACFGGSNGAAQITASGGTGTLTYNWTPGNPPGDGTGSVTGLTAQNYTVTVTDANSCTATRTFNITQPATVVSGTTVVTNVACFGGSNGTINLTPTGGTPGYTFNWLPSGPTTEDRTGLTAGTYSVQITDANGCTGTKTATVTQPTTPVSGTTVVTNVACFGGSNAAINLTPSGGTSPYTFNWLPSGPTTEDRTGLTAGTYSVQITDANGCTGTVTASVTQPTAPVSGTTVVTNVACFGGSNAAINLTPSGGTSPYTFNWLPSGPTTEDRTGLTAGTYSVQITDANGCTGTVTASVTQPTAPVSGTTVVTNVACFGGANGAINLTPAGGTSPYTFNWLPSGPTTEDRTGLTAGSYSVQITDANGCTGTKTATVTQPTTPVSGTTVVTNVACFGGSNAAINLTPSGGTSPYTFNWLPSGPTTEDRTGLTAGTYSVQITDANGCTGTVTASVTQPTTAVSGTTVVTNVACFGGSNAAINLTPSGGTSPYTFNWLPSGPTTEDRTGLTAGSYSVQITDANGCTGTVTASITQPASAVSGTTVVTNVACFSGTSGAINLTPTGGTPGYTFNWLPSGPTTEDRTGLTAGSYSVQITDANGCTGTVTASVTQPTTPVSGTTVVTNVACFGGSNGTINLTPTGGTPGYTFNWLPSGPTTEDRTGLTAGSYSVQITDLNGCTGTVTATVTQPTAPVSGTTVVTNVACFGGSNASINLTPTGGTSPYTFNWLPSGPTTEDRTGLTAGSYSVQITDANGCTGTVTATVTQPTTPVSGTTVVTNVACFGGSNAAINLTPSGGTSPYTFNWLPSGPTTEDRTGLTAGTYSVQITDANGCTGTVTASVTQPTTAVSGTTVVTNVACFGGSNAAINLTPSGGTSPYTFNWLPSGPTTEDRTGLTAGTYSVQITDVNGCTGTVTASVTQPASAVSGTTVVTNVACFGGSNAAINLTPSGGTSPYTFNWLPSGPTTEDRTGLTAGSYSVQITDLNGCTGTVTATVTQPTAPVSGTTVVTNVSCFGGANGTINLTPTGGTPGYTFNWLPSGPTTEDRTGLTAGSYSVQITDLNGCTGTVTATVTQPTAPVSGTTVVTNVACFGGSNASINLTPTGGTSPYTFNWLPSGPTTEDRTGLTAGSYSVQITDANGCTGTVTASVTQPASAVSGTTVVTNVACFGGANGAINLTPTGGTPGYTFNWLPSGPTTEDRTGLTAGSYSVQITDLNGCTGTVTATVTQPTAPVSGTTVVTNVACFGGSNASINLTPTGGTSPYTFNWLPSGPTTEDRTGLTAGSYSVQITDANGCTGTVTASVTQPTAPVSGTTVVTNVACFGGSNAAINLTPSGGTSPYTFNWLPSGPTTEDRTGLTAGTYSVQITDANGCTGTVTASVTQPTAPVSGTTVVTNVACFSGTSGSINLTPSGGTSPYTFNWLPSGPTTEDRTGLTAGSYSVQITDANGCTGTVTASVTQPASAVSGTTVVTNVACFGGSNAAINLTPSGGTSPYTFNWLPSGPTTEDRTGLTAGTYSVQITDANGCTATVTASVTQPASAVSGTTVVTNVACFGGANGAINLTPTGGTPGYTFNWLPSGPTTEDRTGLTAGTYSVQITDANGCTGTKTATVTQPTTPVSGTTVVTNVACFGGSNASINLTPTGGTSPYTFNWLPSGPTTEDRTGLTAGSYSVQITDANGCTGTVTATVTQPTTPVSGTTVVTNVACFGGSNAAINLTPSGGTSPYTFNWLPSGPTTEDRTGLTAGSYSVQITDANGCTATVAASVTQPASAVSGTTVVTNVACFGGSNAAINLTPSGGTSPYTFNWLPSGPTTEDRTGLTAGTYSVQITDANGCTATVTASVTQPTSAVSGTTVVTNVACFGGANGAINLTPTGGTPGYTFNWLPSGPTTEDRTGLTAGSYSVQITDLNGCTGTVTATVTQPTAPVSGTTVVTNVACFGGSNASINLTPTGGTSPYTFNWLPSGPTTEDRTGLTAGSYSVQITDANGCTATVTASVTQPASAVSGTTVVTNVACFGGSNGTINLTPAGGTGPYTFNWLPSGPTTEDRTGLTAGTYSVQITDANGCTATVTASVTQPASAVSGTTVVTNVACFGGSNGTINLTPAGGTSPYTFNWLPSGPTTEDRTGLTAGSYSVQITDANGCTGTVTASVTQPTTPVSGTTVVTNVACFGGSNGTINLTPTGGTPGYTFNWLPSGPTTEDRTGLTAGTYSVQITDANGCTGTKTATVTQPTTPVSGTTVVTNVACFGGSNASINLTPTGGTSPYTFNWLPSGPTTEDRTGLTAGSYSVQITDANGCTGTVTATVTQPTTPVSGTTVVTNVACFGGSNAAINLTPSGGTSPYTFNWLPSGPTTEDRTGLTAGTYSVQITDANGCTATVAASVTQPASAVSGTTVVTNVACFGGSNGTINLTPAGGTSPYTFNWLPSGPTTEDRTGLTAGTYSVQITDLNGCTGTVTATVTQPTAPVSGTTVVTNVSCFGGSNGTINLTPAGGTSPYTFNWLPSGPTTEDRTGLTAGSYSVQITDVNGCTGTVTASVTQPASAVSGTTVVTNVACFGGANGTINLTPSGGTSPYTFNWLPSGPTTEDRTGLTAGSYSVQITDANGCTATVTASVTQPASAVSGTTVVINVACFGGSNAAINLTPSGGTSPYTFNWLPSGPTTEDRTGLTAGSYSVQITDANGCTGTVTASITQPASAVSGTTVVTNTSCFGGTNGTIDLTPAGGTPGYSFNWGGGITTEDRTGLFAGTYTVIITDLNGCTGTINTTITSPTLLTASSTATSILCNGGSSTITVTVAGGTAPYTGTGTFTVTAGTYNYTVTDNNGCTATTTITVSEPTVLTASSAATSILCNGGSATVTVAAANGTAPYTGTGTFTVKAGTYTYTVTDNNGCTATTTITVNEPTAITSSTSFVNSNCGKANGSATVSASGGTGVLHYSWAPTGGSAATATGLVSGSYTVTITDDNNCVRTDVASISDIGPPTVSSTHMDVSCNGLANGSIDNTVSGGTGSYTYSWSNSAVTQDLTSIPAGVYSYTVTDGAGCSTIGSVTVKEPAAIDVSTTLNGNTIHANAADAIYQWIDCNNNNIAIAGETNQSFTSATSGNYAVIIKVLGCADTSSCTTIIVTDINTHAADNTFNLYPNPSGKMITIQVSTEMLQKTKAVYVRNALGELLYTQAIVSEETHINLESISAGVYLIQLETTSGMLFKKAVKE